MANNDYDYDEIDDAILFQAEDGITYMYSPYTLPALPILPFTNHSFSLTPALALPPRLNPPPQEAVLATATVTEGGPGLNGAEASGMARTTRYPPPQDTCSTLP